MKHILFYLLFFITPAFAQNHDNHHPIEDQEIHERFYSTWTMPDARHSPCCNKKDCYPTEARITPNGQWQAKRREDGLWLDVPDHKIETERNNPDGRNHVCAPDPGTGRKTVYCFIAGGGI